MSITRTNSVWHGNEHFQPDENADPQAQRRLRGHLEKIDYTAYASNREIIGKAFGPTDIGKFQRLALTVAQARADWVLAGLEISESAHTPDDPRVEKLAQLRMAYQEFAEAYDAMRRMVERGYLNFTAP